MQYVICTCRRHHSVFLLIIYIQSTLYAKDGSFGFWVPDVKQYYDPDWLLMVSRFFNICRVDTLTLAVSVIGYWLKELQGKMVTTKENSVSRTKLSQFNMHKHCVYKTMTVSKQLYFSLLQISVFQFCGKKLLTKKQTKIQS